jgi:LysM repeat protein
MEERNQRPQEASKLPVIALGVLVFVIGALLYVGYEYAADTSSSTADLTNVKQDPTMQAREVPDDETTPPAADPKPARKAKAAEVVPPANVPDGPSNSEADARDEAPEKPAKARPEVAAKKPETRPKAEAESNAKPTGAALAEKKPQKKPEPAKSDEAPAAPVKLPAGGTTVTHTVADGQTFYGIANRYNVKWETLKKLNPQVEDASIKVGVTKLRIPVRAVHTVGPGDILRVVAQKYGITVEQLMAANGKTKNVATRGEKLIIPYPVKE